MLLYWHFYNIFIKTDSKRANRKLNSFFYFRFPIFIDVALSKFVNQKNQF